MSRMKKITFTREFPAKDIEYLQSELGGKYEFLFPVDYGKESLLKLAPEIDVLIGREIFQEFIDAALKLRVIHSPGVGVDGMDLGILRGRNIKLCNSRSNSKYVAEFAISLMFTLIKKIHIHNELMKRGVWFRPSGIESDSLYMSDTLFGKTIGFLGFGSIAKNISNYLAPYGNKLIATTRRGRLGDVVNNCAEIVDIEKLFSTTDVVFITIPLTTETRAIVNKQRLGVMKKSAYLINVSRGAVIEEASLYDVLENRLIAGAAIDVWENVYKCVDGVYPSKEFAFHKLENLLLSPYRAGYINDISPHFLGVVENLTRYSKTGDIQNIVDLQSGY